MASIMWRGEWYAYLHVPGEEQEYLGVVAVLLGQQEGLDHVTETQCGLGSLPLPCQGVERHQCHSIAGGVLGGEDRTCNGSHDRGVLTFDLPMRTARGGCRGWLVERRM